MAPATKAKPEPAPQPISFDEIAHKRMAERITTYRELVGRHAAGQTLSTGEMETIADLLDLLGLPQYAFTRDVAAMQRHTIVQAKTQAAVEAVPENKVKAIELAAKIEETRKQLQTMQEQHRIALAKSNKPAAYGHTLAQLASEHPTVLADIATATRLRCEELDRRKRATVGGAT